VNGLMFLEDALEQHGPECPTFPANPNDMAFWLYSSGSTGNPKGVVHTGAHIYWATELFGLGALGINENDVILSPPKMYFVFGLGNQVYFPIRAGAQNIANPEPIAPEAVWEQWLAHEPTVVVGVPTLFANLLRIAEDKIGRKRVLQACRRLRVCVSGGEILPTALMDRWQQFAGVEILDGVGTTEMTHIFMINRPGHVVPGSCGRLVAGYHAELIDDNGAPVPAGEIGNLLVFGPTAAEQYWNKPEKTAQVMGRGGVLTGDKLYRDQDGNFFLVGRSDDMLRVGGIWVSPAEVESVIAQHEAVLECAIVGHPDEHDMIKPKAYVILRERNSADVAGLAETLRNHVREQLAHIKCPHWFEFVDELPKTSTGKIQRFRLREDQAPASSMPEKVRLAGPDQPSGGHAHITRALVVGGVALALAAAPVFAQTKSVKIGFISTFSGPTAMIGQDMRNSFELALDHLDRRMGGLPVEVIYEDDQQKPEVGRQKAEKLVQSDKADFVVGFIWSNVLLASLKPVLDSQTFLISTNAGPSQIAGELCSPFFFSTSWQNDQTPEAMGQYMNQKGIKALYLVGPNYAAGKDILSSVKSNFKGQVIGEAYTRWPDQLDFSAELTKLRAAKPDAAFVFYPGASGVQFLTQYAQAGLKGQIPLYTVFTIDAITLQLQKDLALGVPGAQQWVNDLPNAANMKYVADFRSLHKNYPSFYGAQTYDAANLVNSAVVAVKGDLSKKDAVRDEMRKANYQSVRGPYRYGNNHFPIQNFYLQDVVKDADGNLTLKTAATILKDSQDKHHDRCLMKW
jgi:branched-chain amino acid transport system substrate-binding protein